MPLFPENETMKVIHLKKKDTILIMPILKQKKKLNQIDFPLQTIENCKRYLK